MAGSVQGMLVLVPDAPEQTTAMVYFKTRGKNINAAFKWRVLGKARDRKSSGMRSLL